MFSGLWSKGVKRGVLIIGLFVLFCLSQATFFVPLMRSGGVVYDSWNLFHYVLNARYYTELRYDDLYACAIEADQAGQQFYAKNSQVRELSDYSETTVEQYRPCPRERFTTARWNQFGEDLAGLQQQPILLDDAYRGDRVWYWNSMLSDKGYNLPPPQVVLSQMVLRLTDVFGRFQLPLIVLLDPLFLVLAFIQVRKAFGGRSAIVGFLVLSWFWGTEGFILGFFLQHVWLAFVLFSVCALKRERFIQAGIWMACATMTRIFPIFLIVPFVPIALQAWRFKDKQKLRQLKNFFQGFGLTCLGLFLVSLDSGLGMQGWILFAHKMQLHSRYITGEVFDIGFKNLIATAAGPNATDATRLVFFARFKWQWLLVASVSTFFLLWRIRNSKIERSILFGLPLLYLWIVTAPYYWLVLVLIPMYFLSKDQTETLQTKKKQELTLIVLAALFLIHLAFGWSGISYYVHTVQLHLLSETSIALYLLLFTWTILPRPSQAKTLSIELKEGSE